MDFFSHDFSETVSFNNDFAEKADVIFYNYNGVDGKEILNLLIKRKKDNAQLILIAKKEHILGLSEFLSEITDIWTLPMSDDEIEFRFLRWQQTCKMSKDYWQTNHFLESTINSTPNLIWYKNKEGIHEKVNDSFCQTVNKTKKQVEGKDHFYIWDVDPSDPESGRDCMESDLEVIRSKRICVSEETVMSGNEMKILTTYKFPLYDLDGTVMGTAGIGIDITQERLYEQEIIKKNHVLEAIFASVDCGILCHSTDGKHIINVNRTALKILGYKSYDELTSKFDMIAESVIDEDKLNLLSAIKTLNHEGDSVSVEYRVKHNDGKVIHVMGNVKLLKENGEFFYQRFLLDCTAQKQQEQENERRQMEMIQALSIDYNRIVLIDLDDDTCTSLRSDNNGASSLYIDTDSSFEENMEKHVHSFVFSDDKEMMQQFLSVDFLKKEFSSKELLYVNFRIVKNGEIEYYGAKAVKVGTWDGHHRVVLGFRNVDEETRHEMEQKRLLETALVQANSANKAKSVFLSNMSHDIRTPMNAIIGFTNLAISKIEHKEKVKEYLYKIISSGNHLLGLINDVLDISQIESGKLQLEETLCSLPEFVNELQNIIHTNIQSKQLHFDIETDIVNKEIYCDILQLNRVFINIINNSIKYTENGGKIKVRIMEKNNAPAGYANYELSVKDTGIGMSKEFVDHIFELFSRERNTTNSGIQGTGLGMAITKNIVDMMNGSIDVKSKQGVGTEVVINFTFRVHSENNSNEINMQSVSNDFQHEEINNLKKPDKTSVSRILLVEDNELNQEIASEILKEVGFEVEIAGNGKVAVEMLARSKPDYYKIVLMDIQMPVMNGYEATKEIRKLDNKKLASIPILAMTANAFAEDQQEALKCGMNGHLAKPIDVGKLLDALNKY